MYGVTARNIDDVIEMMSAILKQSMMLGDRIGYFAGLYRMVTIVVRNHCNQGHFHDNERMRELDTMFANRYFIALDAYAKKQPLTASWRAAFDAAKNPDLMVMQHLLLGMNAHINLDLGIATAEVSGGVLTPTLRQDFDRLNIILTELSKRVKEEIAQVSPLFRRFEPLSKHFEEMFVRVGISTARTRAWSFAEQLVQTPHEDWDAVIAKRDVEVAMLGYMISHPNAALLPLIKMVNDQEKKDVHTVVSILCEETWERPMLFDIKQVREIAKRRGIDIG